MTLALLHGFLGVPESWEAIATALPSDARVLRPVLMGHGGARWGHTPESFDDSLR